MECRIIDFISCKKQQMQMINLNILKGNHLCTLVSTIADELLIIDKQLSILQHSESKIIQNEYNHLKNVNERLMSVIKKINEHFFDKKPPLEVTPDEFHYIFEIIESHLQNLLLIKKDTLKLKKLYALHEALEPIYNENKAILEKLSFGK